MCEFHSIYVSLLQLVTQFLPLLRYIVLLCVLVYVCPLWLEGCVGSWAHVFFLLSLLKQGIVQAKAFVSIAYWAHTLVFLLYGYRPLTINLVILLHCVCHDLVLSLLLITPMGLLASVPTVLAHWPINSLQWASLVHLLHLYLLSFLWAY